MADRAFSETVQRARGLRGLTQTELATQAGISRQALAAIEAGSYLPNVAIAVRLARVIGITVEELFGDADEDREHCIDARWKKSAVVSANKKGVILARVGGKIVARAQPSACLTLPVSSGIRMNTAGSQARISTRLLDDEIDGTLIVAGCDPAVALLIAWMARTGSRINAVALPC